tara:strand:- start:350 stop:844 length:495 start_codon:yes stop_codon:yes gene_type:complete
MPKLYRWKLYAEHTQQWHAEVDATDRRTAHKMATQDLPFHEWNDSVKAYWDLHHPIASNFRIYSSHATEGTKQPLDEQVRDQLSNLFYVNKKRNEENSHFTNWPKSPDSYKQLASVLGVAQSNVSRSLGKDCNLTLRKLMKIVEAMDGEIEIKITPNYTKGDNE